MDARDWKYEVFEPETRANEFGLFSPIVELWQERRSQVDGALPQRSAFAFEDFTGWHGRISIGRITPDMSSLVFTLWGTTLTDLWGKDYTGQSMADDSLPGHWDKIEKPYVAALVSGGGIGLCGGTLHVYRREFVHVNYVDLPIAGDAAGGWQVLSAYQRADDHIVPTGVKPLYRYIEPY